MANPTITFAHTGPDFFFGSIARGIGGLVRTGVSVARNLPGPLGDVAGIAHRALNRPPPSLPPTPYVPPPPSRVSYQFASPGGPITMPVQNIALPGRTLPPAPRSTGTAVQTHGGTCTPVPCGFRKAKATYVRKIDPRGDFVMSNLEIVPKGAFIEGKRRSMNASNGKANDRAIKRLERGEAQAKKLLRAVGYRTIKKGA